MTQNHSPSELERSSWTSSQRIRDIERNGENKSVSSSFTLRDYDEIIPQKVSKKEKCCQIIDSNVVTFFMTLVTIYALYCDDTRILGFDKSSDIYFTVLTSISFSLFLIEILIQCWCRPKYFRLPTKDQILEAVKQPPYPSHRRSSRSHHDHHNDQYNSGNIKRLQTILSALQIGCFYFWLDLLATVSMLIEIVPMESLSVSGEDDLDLESTRAGRASRAGAKAARLLKIVRMIRLVRLVKLYKYFSAKGHANNSSTASSATIAPSDGKRNSSVSGSTSNENDDLEKMPPESHVGAAMSDRTTKRVIIGILIMLIGIPILQVEDFQYVNEYGMDMVLERRSTVSQVYGAIFDYQNAHEDSSAIQELSAIEQQELLASTIQTWEFTENLFLQSTNCIQLTYLGFADHERTSGIIPYNPNLKSESDLRAIEKVSLTISSSHNDEEKVHAVFDVSKAADEEAFLNVILTTFVILLLAVGTMVFSRDVNILVIIPIEKMVQLVREISANPLGKDFSLKPEDIKQMDDGMETTLLLRTISKIAGLMRVGFGEAGAEIIGKNLGHMSSSNATNEDMLLNSTESTPINLLVGNGSKIHSIFGFCDIRNFTDTTECLQEEVMLFVNRIAHILHSIVVQCDGAANKNIGDAFLLTWKIDARKTELQRQQKGKPNEEVLHKNQIRQKYCGDKALYSMVKTMVEMNRHEDFICNFSPSALGSLYERIPGYKCQIGCGLHFGWAIEGAIGSDKKIDASYISPHVNWAEFLEGSTKEYGVPILMSEPFYNLLSPEAMKYCRQVDRIKKSVDDDIDVVNLYTYDIDLNSMNVSLHSETRNGTLLSDTSLNLNQGHTKRNTLNAGNIGRNHGRMHQTIKYSDSRVHFNQNNEKTKFGRKTSNRKSHRHRLTAAAASSDRGHHHHHHHHHHRQSRASSKDMQHSNSGLGGDAPEIVLPFTKDKIKTFTPDIWEEDEDMELFRVPFSESHRKTWDAGIQHFLEGDWENALVHLSKMLDIIPNKKDKPTERLLKFMEKHDFKPPKNWEGYMYPK